MSKARFRSKRKGKSPQFNVNGQGVTTSTVATTMYTVTEDRETLMGILGNLSVRPSTATGAVFFSIQLIRNAGLMQATDPQDDSIGYERYGRLWDYVVSLDGGATETQLVEIVSKKRRKLWIGDKLSIVRNSNVVDVAIFSLQIRGFQLLIG